MKRRIASLAALLLSGALTACAAAADQSGTSPASATPQTFSAPAVISAAQEESSRETQSGRILIAYFSATGNTARVAGVLQEALDGDLFEIVPQDPYTAEDLD